MVYFDPFPQNGPALVSQRENRAKRGFKRVTRMVLASLGYNYGIQSPTGSNPKLLKENYVLSLWTCVGDNRSSTKLHCATLFVGCNPMFFAYNPIVAGTHVF